MFGWSIPWGDKGKLRCIYGFYKSKIIVYSGDVNYLIFL